MSGKIVPLPLEEDEEAPEGISVSPPRSSEPHSFGGGVSGFASLTNAALRAKADSNVTVECTMELTVDVPASKQAREQLQKAVVAEIYMREESVINFFAFEDGRHTINKGSKSQKYVWKWKVSFDVVADLSELTFKSPEELEVGIGAFLSGNDFANTAAMLLDAKKAVVDPRSVCCEAKTTAHEKPLFGEDASDAAREALAKVKRAAKKAQALSKLKNPNEDYCIIQWETAAFFTYESEVGGEPIPIGAEPPPFTAMSVGISRLGASTGRSTIHWKTFDMSAKAGVNYVEQKPTQVFFDIGETHKDVIVKVLPNPVFKGTMEFGLYLLEDSVQGADVGKYLHTATIKIIDTAAFPTNDLLHLVRGGDRDLVAKVPPFTLLLEFWQCCYAQPVPRKGTQKLMLAHQYKTLVAILNLLLGYYLVKVLQEHALREANRKAGRNRKEDLGGDIIFGKPLGENADFKLEIIATLMVIPFIGCHYLDFSACYWKVGGSLRKYLKSLLLKKFLNYREDSRAQVAIEKLIMAMTRDVGTAISEVYMVGTALVFGCLFKIVALIGFVLFINANTDEGITGAQEPMIKVMIMPVLILIWLLKLRQKPGFKLRQAQFEKEESMINHVIKCVINYTLIADYDRRTFMMGQYEAFVGAYNKATTAFSSFCVNSAYFAPWLTVLIVGQTVLFDGKKVLEGKLGLSTFLSSISALKQLGAEFQTAYGLILRMNNAYASVAQLTVFLNLPVDVPDRRVATRRRRKEGKRQRALVREDVAKGVIKLNNEVPVDRLPIKVIDVKFTHKADFRPPEKGPPPQSSPSKSPLVSEIPAVRHGLEDLDFELEQGKLVCILGPPGEGKGTVLRLLSYMVFPDKDSAGTIFVPPHIRAVQIQQDPFILGPEETVFDNLAYGMKVSPSTDWSALENRCRGVLSGVGGEKAASLLENLKVKGYLGVDGCKVTRMSRQLIHIARALVMNPEMLIVHKPMPLLSPEVRPLVFKAFQEYCHNRGYLMSATEPFIRRRKRTLIYTGYTVEDATMADIIFVLQSGRLTEISKEKVGLVVSQFGKEPAAGTDL